MNENIRAPADIFKPQTFEDYVGQPDAKKFVQIMMEAADKDDRPFPSMLFTGTAGLGKTSLAQIVLSSIPNTFIDGNAVNGQYEKLRDFVIIDEIHNVKPDVCDSLNLLLDKESVIILGCTTNPGMLPGPFRSRFRTVNLLPYTIPDLVQIMKNVLSRKKTLEIEDDYLTTIAERGRRTPRTTLQYLAFVMDMMLVNNLPRLDNETLHEAFSMLGIDEKGLLPIDRRYLDAFPKSGRPVGLQYLSAVTATDKETIEEEIEPYLLSLGLIDRTPKGRIRLIDSPL